MKKNKLIHTEHYQNSIVEVYMGEENNYVYQVKCLTRNRCKTYKFEVESYIQNKMLGYKIVETRIKLN
jgi:hypothetical protein|tara:strand:- start:4435 stop:4638 length:204 start_codon:yes stop_codon:yes gene_type:complete